MHQLGAFDEEVPNDQPVLRRFHHGGDTFESDAITSDQRSPPLCYDGFQTMRPPYPQSHSADSRHGIGRRPDRSFAGQLSLRTMTNTASTAEYPLFSRANTDSPGQRTQSIGGPSQAGYPFFKPEVVSEEASSSPRNERLPSFHQLSQIADGGTEGSDPRAVALPSLSTYTQPQTQTIHPPHFAPSQLSSPSTSFTLLGQPSPTHTRSEGHELHAVPQTPAYPGPGVFPRRRSIGSARPPTFLSALTSSSSNDTSTSLQSRQSSVMDSYSTNHSTPVESCSSVDGTPKPGFHHPPRLQHSTSSSSQYICDYPGCTAPPFQTQYLLNSHANVHSSNRPHYCPVKGCARAEGGKGFKRKNEMIRHGLVHDSPGYICPFCPLREHKYPRPDNLQRHVRVHHVDKDKDDPQLREVLAQRPEGGGRGRRRRTGP